jgi:UPF0755 protein
MGKQKRDFFERRNFFLGLVLFFLVTSFFTLGFYFLGGRPVGEETGEQIFAIPPGENLKLTALRLEEEGLIRNWLVFLATAYQQGLNQKIQAGEFYLSVSMTTSEIAHRLTRGSSDVWITIVPGVRAEQVALVVKKELVNFDSIWLAKLKAAEGYLTPDSYLIPKQADWEIFWQIIKDNYDLKVTENILEQAEERGIREEELIILASLVEREAKTASDRREVAGVLLNRLNSDWPLQVDASIQYALASLNCPDNFLDQCVWWPRVAADDINQAVSAYNTYLNKGLPPAPICSPSSVSIEAVAQAPLNSPFWYYLSDQQGKIHLAKNLAEHEENVNRYLR